MDLTYNLATETDLQPGYMNLTSCNFRNENLVSPFANTDEI